MYGNKTRGDVVFDTILWPVVLTFRQIRSIIYMLFVRYFYIRIVFAYYFIVYSPSLLLSISFRLSKLYFN